MKGFLIFLVLIISAIAGIIYLTKSDKEPIQEKCCVSCEKSGGVKTYSIETKYDYCGEACQNPKLLWLYKIFEPGLTLAGNTTCKDLGYTEYFETMIHGVYPLKVTVDLYKKP